MCHLLVTDGRVPTTLGGAGADATRETFSTSGTCRVA
jgi:hypothetical protein